LITLMSLVSAVVVGVMLTVLALILVEVATLVVSTSISTISGVSSLICALKVASFFLISLSIGLITRRCRGHSSSWVAVLKQGTLVSSLDFVVGNFAEPLDSGLDVS